MGKLGKALLIFGIIALVGAIAFGCTVAAFGVTNGDWGVRIGGVDIDPRYIGIIHIPSFGNPIIKFRDGQTNISFDYENNKEYDFEYNAQDINKIVLGSSIGKNTVSCVPGGNTVSVRYTTGTRPVSFTSVYDNGVLTIDEKTSGFSWFGSGTAPTLLLSVPDVLYDALELNQASGSTEINSVRTQDLRVSVASGKADVKAEAGTIGLSLASGSATITNTGDRIADSIEVNTASGKAEINGFKANRSDFQLASGSIIATGISGKVSGQVMSGKLSIAYSEWNRDLELQIASGSADITLPSGSGLDLDLERLSGSMSVSLDGHEEKFTKNVETIMGGSNVNDVEVNIASGSVRIHN